MDDGKDACAEGEGPLGATTGERPAARAAAPDPPPTPPPPGMDRVLLVECGWGNDGHGQDSTKAAVRAARNAIEFNSLPLRALIPGGVANMVVHVRVGVPNPQTVDAAAVAAVFPYGRVTVDVVPGGLATPSYIALASQGDANDDMVIAVAAVTVGHGPVGGGGGGGRPAVPSHGGYAGDE